MTSLKLGDNLSSSFGNLISDTLILAFSFEFFSLILLGQTILLHMS